MTATETASNTFLEDNFAPVDAEVTAWDLTVRGTLPPALEGTYVRNGPNPVAADPGNYHWFNGEGMLHGVRLSGGRAQWYRNRWVRSPKVAKLKGLDRVPADEGGFQAGPGNTNIVPHAGSLWALTEGSLPYRLDTDFETLSQENFGGRLPYGINAHPKIDPVTGSMHVLSYAFLQPTIGYHEIDAEGHMVRTELVETTSPVMVHDMAMTGSWVVVMDLPVVFDMDMAAAGVSMPFRWDDDYPARVGLLPRNGTADEVRWCPVDPCYVFHPLNAYDDGDTVVVDVARHGSMFRAGLDKQPDGPPALVRWRLDPAACTLESTVIDDRPQEFPRIDERRTGLPHRFGYTAGVAISQMAGGADVSSEIIAHDLVAGTSQVHHLGPGRSAGEFVFVADPEATGGPGGSNEGEGWLMGYVFNAITGRSELVVLDATNVAGDPVAIVDIPVRIPAGFHGNWIPDPPH